MIDHVRALFPHLGIAVYAYEPGKPVTVEVFTPDGTSMKKTAATEAEALIAVFGPDIFHQEEEQPHELPALDPVSEDDDIFG